MKKIDTLMLPGDTLVRAIAYSMKAPKPHITRANGEWITLTMGLWQTQRENCLASSRFAKKLNDSNKPL